MSGRLGNYDLKAGVVQSVYQNTKSLASVVSLNLCNRNAFEVTVRVSITASESTVTADEYVEFETVIPGNTSFFRTGIFVPSAEYLTARSDTNNVSAVVMGNETGSDLEGVVVIETSSGQVPTWSTSADLGTIYAPQQTSVQLTAVDPEGVGVRYTVTSGTTPPGTTLNAQSGLISGRTTADDYDVAGVTDAFTVQATDDSGALNSRNFTVLRKFLDGSTTELAAPSAEVIYEVDNSFSDGIKYIDTPDGGIQQVYCCNAGGHGYMLVGRVNADASSNITDRFDSQRALVDVSQSSGGNVWSADFGNFAFNAFMVWSASDFPNRTGTGLNWIYYPEYRYRDKFKRWIGNYEDSSPKGFDTDNTWDDSPERVIMGDCGSGSKRGQRCSGAEDGPFTGSRWNNPAYRHHRISDDSSNRDLHYTVPNGFSNPTTDMFYIHGQSDAKFSVHQTQNSSGQDDNSTALFGFDDGNRAFFDRWPNNEGNNSNRRDYSHAVTFRIR